MPPRFRNPPAKAAIELVLRIGEWLWGIITGAAERVKEGLASLWSLGLKLVGRSWMYDARAPSFVIVGVAPGAHMWRDGA